MCLNLIIRSDKLYKSKGTGVFVRDSGGTRELETIDEIKTFFPEFDTNTITQEYCETYDVWEKSITHNLAFLASYIKIEIEQFSLYTLLWKPKDAGIIYLNNKYVDMIRKAIEEMKENSELYKKYGSESEMTELLNFTQSLYNCISNLKINYSDEYKIISER